MKKLLLLACIFIVIVAIPLTVYLASQRQEIRKKAAPASTLSIIPANTTKTVPDEFTLEVQIDTGENQVIAAELHLTFDSEILEALSITNGVLFPNVLTSGLVEPGAASITVGAPSNAQPVMGRGTAAVIRFKALAETTSPVSVRFATSTHVSDLSEGSTSVLVNTTPASVTILGGGDNDPEPTPEPTPQLSDSPDEITPTATPSALTILTPTTGLSTVDMPTIRGLAPPGATITLTIYSDPLTVVVTADSNGNWSYTPPNALEPGPHSVVATAQSSASGTLTTTSSFVIATGSGSASQSAIPVSGSAEWTLALLAAAFLLIGIGITIPIVVH